MGVGGLKRVLVGLIAAVAVLLMVTVPARAEEAILVSTTEALTTGTVTVANNAFSSFYAPAGTLEVRALDDATTATTKCYVKYFATAPSSDDLDASTREKSGVAVQEGDRVRIVLTDPGWIGIDGATGTSNIVGYLIE